MTTLNQCYGHPKNSYPIMKNSWQSALSSACPQSTLQRKRGHPASMLAGERSGKKVGFSRTQKRFRHPGTCFTAHAIMKKTSLYA